MNNIFTYIVLILIGLLMLVLKVECYEYDNLGMNTVSGSIVGIREYNGTFYVYVIDSKTDKGYCRECKDFHEAFAIQQRLLNLDKRQKNM